MVRHCIYTTEKAPLKYDPKLNLNTCLKEEYDPVFKSQNLHLGQRKLLLSEIQLITEFYKSNFKKTHSTVLYIGAAYGKHLLILHQMFPMTKFILYDGAPFYEDLYKLKDVFEIHTGEEDGIFTTEKCKALKEKLPRNCPLLFVSDIRLAREGFEKFEEGALHDMNLQKEWVKIMNPQLSLLKFRMNYSSKKNISYLKGDIYMGIWPKPTSGETRLLVRRADIKKDEVLYNFEDYEKAMFFHNKYIRPHCFSSKLPANYCTCYDCVAERQVLEDFINLVNNPKKPNTPQTNITSLDQAISIMTVEMLSRKASRNVETKNIDDVIERVCPSDKPMKKSNSKPK